MLAVLNLNTSFLFWVTVSSKLHNFGKISILCERKALKRLKQCNCSGGMPDWWNHFSVSHCSPALPSAYILVLKMLSNLAPFWKTISLLCTDISPGMQQQTNANQKCDFTTMPGIRNEQCDKHKNANGQRRSFAGWYLLTSLEIHLVS